MVPTKVTKLAKISVRGVVQGVGFRPFVYRLAQDHNLKGWVRNTSGNVEIEVEGDKESLENFLIDLKTKAPPIIGEMTGVVGDCVQFYFDFISQGTLAEGAALSFVMVPPTARCRGCDKTFELREFDWVCPYCQGNNMEIIAGKELFVESIEVE